MRPNLPFLSAASNALLKPGGLLRWKKWLVKDARHLLPLTEVTKIARLTFLLLEAESDFEFSHLLHADEQYVEISSTNCLALNSLDKIFLIMCVNV